MGVHSRRQNVMWHVTEMKHVFLYKLLGKIITDYRKELQGRKVRSNKKKIQLAEKEKACRQ